MTNAVWMSLSDGVDDGVIVGVDNVDVIASPISWYVC